MSVYLIDRMPSICLQAETEISTVEISLEEAQEQVVNKSAQYEEIYIPPRLDCQSLINEEATVIIAKLLWQAAGLEGTHDIPLSVSENVFGVGDCIIVYNKGNWYRVSIKAIKPKPQFKVTIK